MTNEKNTAESRKMWLTPTLTVYGDVEALTLQNRVKAKQPGSIDDFGVSGVSDAGADH